MDGLRSVDADEANALLTACDVHHEGVAVNNVGDSGGLFLGGQNGDNTQRHQREENANQQASHWEASAVCVKAVGESLHQDGGMPHFYLGTAAF
jgi:hypothetical protein